jgi:amphiphysin
MTTTQARLAETMETFYGAADRTSDGAMASHAFKSAVEELDGGVQRELVCDTCFY